MKFVLAPTGTLKIKARNILRIFCEKAIMILQKTRYLSLFATDFTSETLKKRLS
jgi:hypothetical protein